MASVTPEAATTPRDGIAVAAAAPGDGRDHVARTLPVVLWLTLLGSVASAILALVNGDTETVAGVIAVATLVAAAIVLTRRRRMRLASLAFIGGLLLVAVYLLWIGHGLRDVGILVYPLILIVGGLLLDGSAFAVLLALSLGTLILVALERPLGNDPLPVAAAAGPQLLYISIILSVTAAVVWLLASALRRSLAEARTSEREARRAAAEREALLRELEAKNAELERFSYTVSHDLKSPLITVQSFIGFLEQDAASGNLERLRADVARIRGAGEKMLSMLDELLELSRIGRIANAPSDLRFAELAQDALGLVRGRLDQRGVAVEVAPDLPVVRGDRGRLVLVLQNLLDNAVKFMGTRPDPRIEIGWRREDGLTVLYVRDNGIGIDPRHHEKVFGLFEKLDPASGGTGLGLALVRRVVETHQGRIWVESRGEGHGTAFCFTLGEGSSSA